MLKYINILAVAALLSLSPAAAIAQESSVDSSSYSEQVAQENGKEESYGITDIKQAKQRAWDISRVASYAKRIIEKIKAKGGTVPAEYENPLNSLIEIADLTRKSDAIVPDAMLAIEKGAEQMDKIIIPGLSAITEWQNTLKEAEKDLRNLSRQFEHAKKKSGKSDTDTEKISLSIQLSLSAAIDALAAADNMAKEGDAKNALVLYFGTADKKIKDLSDKIGVFDNASNMPFLIKKMDIETARLERRIKQLNAGKEDTKAISAIIDSINEKRGQINKSAVKTEDIFDILVWFEKTKKSADTMIESLEEKKEDSSGGWWF